MTARIAKRNPNWSPKIRLSVAHRETIPFGLELIVSAPLWSAHEKALNRQGWVICRRGCASSHAPEPAVRRGWIVQPCSCFGSATRLEE